AWVGFGAVASYVMTTALAHEMETFPGGSVAFAESLRPGLEALRPMRWPAERLDTLGGYLSYHNLTLITLSLAVYGAVRGAAAVRAGEDQHSLEEVLATGWPRAAVVRDRTLGFLVVMAAISFGLALGVGVALATAGEPDWSGSLIAHLTSGLVAMVGYGLGLLVSQLTLRSRTASGVSAGLLVILYVLTNLWDELGPLGAVRFVSPFHWANASRALVPGEGLDLAATAVLISMTVVLVALAAVAFERRDYRGVLWARRPSVRTARRPVVQRRMLSSVWTAAVLRGGVGLVWWAVAGAALAALMAFLGPIVMDAWDVFEGYFGGAGASGTSPEELYLSFSGEVIMPVIAAYVLTQASGWTADLAQGRVEAVLAAPVSWARLVTERVASVAVGVTALTAGALGGLVAAASAVGISMDVAGLVRLALGCLLLGLALAGVASMLVVLLRTSLTVTALAIFVGLSYLLSLMGPMLRWPDWVSRLSVFTAFGHPYLEWPSWGGTLLLLSLALVGTAGAAVLAGRTPKVA
ncbi:MAG TPA: ABC transporter permease subunit, partial [Dermatophilaceae bacterium]|nr:ABC transporter permease subunit [Dermatophilaceae bacterium]